MKIPSNQFSYNQKAADVKREWVVVDAKGRVLGQVATEVATKLMGKHRPTYTPHNESGDYVIVINAKDVEVTRAKAKNKIYYSYSGYAGGLRKTTFEEMQALHPERIIEKAVYGMLPDNRLRSVRMARLKIYAGADHRHESQVPAESTESTEAAQ